MGRNLVINGRNIGDEYAPLVIPEIGINHGGDIKRAIQMIEISSVQSK
jgi:sialic acid synthase SpsE